MEINIINDETIIIDSKNIYENSYYGHDIYKKICKK